MKRLVASLLIALSLVIVTGPTAVGAEKKKKKSDAAAASAKPALAGKYAGEWKGKDGSSSGALRIGFKQDDAGAWSADAAFTFEGNEVPVKTKSLKVEGEKVEVVFEWTIQGTNGQSKLSGEVKGNKLEGKYDSNVAEAPSSGTWSITRT